MDLAFGEAIGGCGSCSRQNGGAKRKLSAYNLFMKKELARLKKLHPAMTAPQRMKMAAKNWKASPAHKKTSSSKTNKTRRSTGK